MFIHQTWSNSHLPFEYDKNAQSWRALCENQQWQYQMWTDESNEQYLKEHYDWLYTYYEECDLGVERSYLMRYIYMYDFGGIYVDLDCECVQPDKVIKLTQHPWAPVCLLEDDISFIYSEARDPFWSYVLNHFRRFPLPKWRQVLCSVSKYYDALQNSGQYFCRTMQQNYPHREQLFFLPEMWVQQVLRRDRISYGYRDWDYMAVQWAEKMYQQRDRLLLAVIAVLLVTLLMILVFRR
jgi:hypothetical protein